MFTTPISYLYIIDLLGVSVFAISGALSAGRKGLDLFGVLIISVVSAIGGGTLRDLLLNRHPIFWIDDPTYLFVIICSSIFTLIYVRRNKPPLKALLIADALGLSFFTIMGTQIAESFELHSIISVLMGVITGVAGGMIRDILSAEVPLILRRDIYATAAICGAALYIILVGINFPKNLASVIGLIIIFVLRLAAIIWKFRLPVFKLPEEPS
ncbi:MAG: trimeric intracellular cation channel family protein [Melioribacteraceae bacterium]|nr:trimeric intracellular cation channel family protein [Melioribacteraceae bacterium]MCF8265624.1 trimeric intracellular cation channel family protein [Melioribacteraceae bacterium]MCF8411880.1 trimeric intracellular cation channel family protein [Melioribacteraceae bacterium]